jgi:glycopeptide antibiotics resistance protein
VRKRVQFLIVTSLLLILIVTLFPFNFSSENLSIKEITQGFYHVSNPLDFIVNILLFIPFGFSCSWCMQLKNLKAIANVLAVLSMSLSLTVFVESSQIFLANRFSTKTDILANCLGGFFGYLSFILCYLFFLKSREKRSQVFQSRWLLIWLISYFTFSICITIPLSNATTLKDWNSDFPLVLGNEATGDRPWEGSIAQLAIFARPFSQEEIRQFLTGKSRLQALPDKSQEQLATKNLSLVAAYQLSGEKSYQNNMNKFPALTWHKNSVKPIENNVATGVRLTPNQWLATSIPPSFMSEKIRQTSEFTLCTTIATADIKQKGPARIITLSSDPYHRNFTLGQQDHSLVFRLRNPLMGENGVHFEIAVPHAFRDTNYHRLAIAYYDSTIKIYLDESNQVYSWRLMPEAALFKQLFSTNFSYKEMYGYKILYYLLVFVPLGFLLGLLDFLSKNKLVGGYLFLAVVVLQSLLANSNSTGLILGNFLLSIGIASSVFFLVKFNLPHFEQP